MGVNKTFVVTDGNFPGVQTDDILIGSSISASGTLNVGQPFCRDLTQLAGGHAQNDLAIVPSKLFYNARTSDRGVLPTSANAGDCIGIFQGIEGQGIAYTNTGSASVIYVAQCRQKGIGRVLAGAVASGTAVTIGAALIVSSSNAFATVGSRAIGTAVGTVVAYPIFTTVSASVAAGSHTVTPASILGITTSTPLTIDTGTLQEIVTPSAVSTSAGTFTATFANAHMGPFVVAGINSTVGATIIAVPGSGSITGVVLADINTGA
jgi:hypothetical protein